MMMRAPLISTVLLLYYAQQTVAAPFDDGRSFAQSLNGGVVNSAKTANPATTIPGYTTANPPQTSYYGSQNVGGLTSDGVAAIPANPAASQAQAISNSPQMTFSPTDPIFVQGEAVKNNTTAAGASITSSFSACNSTTQTTPPVYETRTCTAWPLPVTSTCDKTLNVNVAQIANCPINTYQNQIAITMNGHFNIPVPEQIHYRNYCSMADPTSVTISFDAYDDNNYAPCRGWTDHVFPKTINMSDYQDIRVFSYFYGVDPTPSQFFDGLWDEYYIPAGTIPGYFGVTTYGDWTRNACYPVPIVINQGGCDATGACNYEFTAYFGLRRYNIAGNWPPFIDTWDPLLAESPNGTVRPEISPMCNFGDTCGNGQLFLVMPDNTIMTFTQATVTNYTFQAPEIVPTYMGETVNNACASLEAQQ